MTENEEVTMEPVDLSMISIGMLGAVSPKAHGYKAAQASQLRMIEQRILRIEMLLRRAGIEPESLPLPE